MLADAAKSLDLSEKVTPAQIVGALAERPLITPEAFTLLRAPGWPKMQPDLPTVLEAARRIAFAMARMAVKLDLPLQSRPEALLQGAMERPEVVTPEEFSVVYAIRATAGIA